MNERLSFCFVIIFSFSLLTVAVGTPVLAEEEPEAVPEEYLLPEEPEEDLEIETIDVRDISETTAVVIMELNHPTYARISYGPGREMDRERSMMRATDEHRFQLTELTEGTPHTFQLQAWVSPELGIRSERMHFETEGTPPPDFVSIDINDRHAFGATIEWRTNIPVEARFYSGHDSENLQYRTEHPVLHPAHRVELEGFYPDSTVYYRIEIEDERGRTHETGLRQFKTRENNIAWRQPVEGTFDQPPFGVDDDRFDPDERFVDRITNGKTNYTDGTATSGDPARAPQWFLVDFQEKHELDRAEFLWRAHAYPESYNIQLFAEEDTPVHVIEGLNAGEGEEVYSDGGMPSRHQVVELDEVEEPIRLIRVEIPLGAPYHQFFPQYDFVQILDFKVFPRELPELDPAVEEE